MRYLLLAAIMFVSGCAVYEAMLQDPNNISTMRQLTTTAVSGASYFGPAATLGVGAVGIVFWAGFYFYKKGKSK